MESNWYRLLPNPKSSGARSSRTAEPQRTMTKKSKLTFLFPLTRSVRLNGITFAILFAATAGNCAPIVDFEAPPLGHYGPVTGHVSGLVAPSEYKVILLDSQNNKIWWDKTHNVHGIPIAEDGSFKIEGWVVDPHDLTVPNIGIWVVPTNFPKFTAEGTDLPEKIPQAAVASKIKNRNDTLLPPGNVAGGPKATK